LRRDPHGGFGERPGETDRMATSGTAPQADSTGGARPGTAHPGRTVNDAVLAAGRTLLIHDPTRFDGVRVLGVDEHCWRHTRRGDKFVTVIIDLTPVRDGTGPARLLDMVEGRSKQVFKTWLDSQSPIFRDSIEVVAMDGFTGFKTAAAETVPDAVAVMDPSMSWRWPATRWTAAANASNRTPADTAADPVTRSTASAGCCAPASSCSPTASTPD